MWLGAWSNSCLCQVLPFSGAGSEPGFCLSWWRLSLPLGPLDMRCWELFWEQGGVSSCQQFAGPAGPPGEGRGLFPRGREQPLAAA